MNFTTGNVKNIHYGDILIKFGTITDCVNDEIPYITEAEISDYTDKLLQDGDIIFADTAEDETVGKSTEVVRISEIPIVSGLHTIACRPMIKMQPYYLGYYINSHSYRRQLLPLMQGIKVLSLSRSNLAKTIILYPDSAQEQAKIGSFLYQLDQRLTSQAQIIERFKQIKATYLKRMFI